MTTVVEIESAIRQLPQDDFRKLADWFEAARARQLAESPDADSLDHLWQAAQLEIEAEDAEVLDVFLADYARY